MDISITPSANFAAMFTALSKIFWIKKRREMKNMRAYAAFAKAIAYIPPTNFMPG
jgi:hypothetical protein